MFTDTKAGQVKQYNPVDNSVSILLGSGEAKSQDGMQSSCSFQQLQGICNMENTLFLTDVSAGKVKLVTGLSSTITFLEMLGSLYDAFKIHPKCVSSRNVDEVSLESARQKVKEVEKYMRDTVTKVKQCYNLKETSTTNGTEGTISHLTLTSLALLNEGIDRLSKNIKEINPDFVDNIALQSLLTTQVENLHAVLHFKHETFSFLQYAQDFGTTVKESLKRTTTWAAKYYTHDKSYYPVPESAMPLWATKVMTPLPSNAIPSKMEEVMKDWVESYRPVRQRTVRSETTKDKAGVLPPAVCRKSPEVHDPQSSNIQFRTDQPSITFVDEATVDVIVAELTSLTEQVDEYETDSEDETATDPDDFSELAVSPVCVTHSGRAVKATLRLDL